MVLHVSCHGITHEAITDKTGQPVTFGSSTQPQPSRLTFHKSLTDHKTTRVHPLPHLAAELGVADVLLKDKDSRLGLPASGLR